MHQKSLNHIKYFFCSLQQVTRIQCLLFQENKVLYTEKGTCDRNKEPGKQLAALFCLLVRFFFLIPHQKETLDISNKSTVRIVIKLCQVVAKHKRSTI